MADEPQVCPLGEGEERRSRVRVEAQEVRKSVASNVSMSLVEQFPRRIQNDLGWVAKQEASLVEFPVLGHDDVAMLGRVAPHGVVRGPRQATSRTCVDPGKRSARARTNRGERFWSSRSLTRAGAPRDGAHAQPRTPGTPGYPLP
jgi:hypothetical protein